MNDKEWQLVPTAVLVEWTEPGGHARMKLRWPNEPLEAWMQQPDTRQTPLYAAAPQPPEPVDPLQRYRAARDELRAAREALIDSVPDEPIELNLPVPVPYEQPPEPGRLSGELVEVLKLVYRKHVCCDDTIGWDELTDKVCDALSNAMGSKEFADWQQEAQR